MMERDESLRPTADKTIGAALVIETTREATLTAMAERMTRCLKDLPKPTASGAYGLIALQDAP